LIFGGKNYRFTAMGRTSILHGGQIQEINAEGPAPRYNTEMVYDSKRGQMVLFGGRIRDGENFIAYGDMWIWDGTKWHVAMEAEGESLREEKLKREVLSAIEQFSAAFAEADVEKLNLLLAPDYRHTNSDGSVVSRERWLEWIKSRREKITSRELVLEKYQNEAVEVVLLSSAVAAATGRNLAVGVDSGRPFRNEIRFTHVWTKENNKWRRTVFHDSRITERNTHQ
jgi:ketosteroid isomerase-like protein